jgi:hypothetical protein
MIFVPLAAADAPRTVQVKHQQADAAVDWQQLNTLAYIIDVGSPDFAYKFHIKSYAGITADRLARVARARSQRRANGRMIVCT